MSTPDVTELQEQIAKLQAELASAQAAPTTTTEPEAAPTVEPVAPTPTPTATPVVSLVDQLKSAATATVSGASPHGFLEGLRDVAETLVSDGKIVEADIVSPGEAGRVTATIVKLLAEVVTKL